MFIQQLNSVRDDSLIEINNSTNGKQARNCPVCRCSEASLFASEYIDTKKLNEFSYSSRKEPEFMRHKLLLCSRCHCVYAPSPPDAVTLSSAYSAAAYDSGEEAEYAARTYMAALSPHLVRLRRLTTAVDVGAGNGALIPLLWGKGFSKVIGIEPSPAAIAAAPDTVRPHILETVFSASVLAGVSPSLVCSFMTLEHLPDPKTFIDTTYDVLEEKGIVAVVVHNWQGFINRLLKLRSPIIDIEHLQLFCPLAIETLLKEAGFVNISINSVKNTYPLRYWLKLMPLPGTAKKTLGEWLKKTGMERRFFSMNVGNILVVAQKAKQGR